MCCRRPWGDSCEPLPPWHQGLGHNLLLHAGGHYHARYYSGVRTGCKCDTETHTLKYTYLTIISVNCSALLIVFLSLQKINRKKHFSKTKHSKFNESGQLSAFYLFSFGWGTSILLSVCTEVNLTLWYMKAPRRPSMLTLNASLLFQENFLSNPVTLWEGYPHTLMP